MRRPSSRSGSPFASVSDSITLARAPATSSFGSDDGSSRGTSRAALFVNRTNTDRRSGLCGTHWEAMEMAFPVYRADRARRDCTESRGGRNWWLTPAGLGCSIRARRESSRPRHWAYSWHRFADCSKPSSSRTLPELDDVASVEEVAGILGKPRRWIIQNAASLPFVTRVSRKHYVCSRIVLRRWLASRPRALEGQ